jgi:hypothetical protein
MVLLRYTTPGEAQLQQQKPNLRQLITRDPRWSLVTFDDLGMLLVRRAGPNAEHAAAFDLPYVEPDGLGFLASPRHALTGLRRELGRGNSALRVLLLAVCAERDAGNDVEAKRLLARAASYPEAPVLLARIQRNLARAH